MAAFYWSLEKNLWLLENRKICFEDLVRLPPLATRQNPSRPNQKVFIYEYQNQIWIVPFVEMDQGLFLKTAYPSRKYKKRRDRGLL